MKAVMRSEHAVQRMSGSRKRRPGGDRPVGRTGRKENADDAAGSRDVRDRSGGRSGGVAHRTTGGGVCAGTPPSMFTTGGSDSGSPSTRIPFQSRLSEIAK